MQLKQETKTIRVIMVGGFLGAGKTTLISRLADSYTKKGWRVGVVTNDQAQNLVDTQDLRSKGFAVEEVSGSCFCCAFNKMYDSMQRLSLYRPDLILLEPVGSCTDLIATVLEPMKQLHRNQFTVTPYMVLVDPQRVRQVFSAGSQDLPRDTAYIYEKQLEEADVLVVTKIDVTPRQLVDEVVGTLRKRFPRTRILTASAVSGVGLNEILSLCESDENVGLNIPDVDYDVYARGEAELGWLNSTVKLTATRPFDLSGTLSGILGQVSSHLETQGVQIAHLKAIVSADGTPVAIANVTHSGSKPELHQASAHQLSSAEITFNARAVIDPETLSHVIEASLKDECEKRAVKYQINALHYLRPSRPVPTYRFPRN